MSLGEVRLLNNSRQSSKMGLTYIAKVIVKQFSARQPSSSARTIKPAKQEQGFYSRCIIPVPCNHEPTIRSTNHFAMWPSNTALLSAVLRPIARGSTRVDWLLVGEIGFSFAFGCPFGQWVTCRGGGWVDKGPQRWVNFKKVRRPAAHLS